MEIERRVCAVCYTTIENQESLVRCDGCPLMIHLDCFLEYEIIDQDLYFQMLSIDIYKEYNWKQCFMCKNKETPQKCKFCGESRGFIIETSEGFYWHPVCWRLDVKTKKEKPHNSAVPDNGKIEKVESQVDKKIDVKEDKKMETEIMLVLNQSSSSIEIELSEDILSPLSQGERDGGFLEKSKINTLQEEKNEHLVSSSSAILSPPSPDYQPIVVESENDSSNLELENFLLTNFFQGIMRKDVLKAFHKENLSKSIDEILAINNKTRPEEFASSRREPLFKLFLGKKIIISNSVECIPETFQKPKDFQSILDKINNNRIYGFCELINDLWNLFHYSIKNRCFSNAAFNYVSNQNYELMKLIDNSRKITKGLIPGSILKNTAQNLCSILSLNLEYLLETQPISKNYRYYQDIKFYVSGIVEDETLLDRLKTPKTPFICSENCCCFSIEQMGSFSLEKSFWSSKCPNRRENMECGSISHKGRCWNQSISMLRAKILGVDVEEQICWGVDCYTKAVLVELLGKKFNEDQKYKFIQYDLIKALNQQKEKGWDLKTSLLLIQNDASGIFEFLSKKIAKKAFKLCNLNVFPKPLTAHCKGQGLICINRNGFKKNEFIIEYFGEVYPPWRWFEKQDLIRKKVKETSQTDLLFDFYNIMLETHKNDPNGYDLLFVDPIHKGNFSSRLSHSCDPNCGTVTTVSNGNYIIAMYAMKDISYGEELTFDYCSYSEDFNECKKAICLCGAKNCRGSYLEFSKSQGNLSTLEHSLSFLKRQSFILKACSTTNLTEPKRLLLEKYSIKENVLKDCPKWLIIWISLVLEFIDEEKRKNLSPNGLRATGISENRIQNLVISVDKIKYFLGKSSKKKMSESEPPLKILTNSEIFEILWGKLEKSKLSRNEHNVSKTVIQDVLNSLLALRKETDQLENIINLIFRCDQEAYKIKTKDPFKAVIFIRLVFLKISRSLKELAQKTDNNCFSGSLNCHFLAISDILYFHAFTKCYFKAQNYEPVTSSPVCIRNCELSNQQTYGQNAANSLAHDAQTQYSEAKAYKPLFVWAQMIYWYKQTAVNPENVLAVDRRGTLLYPSLHESFGKNKLANPFLNISKKKIFEFHQNFYSNLKKNPNIPWSVKFYYYKWSFRQSNQNNVFGTIFFDSVFYANNKVDSLKMILDSNNNELKDLFHSFLYLLSGPQNITENEFMKLVESLNKCESEKRRFCNGDAVRLIRKMRGAGKRQMIRKPIRKLQILDFKNKKTKAIESESEISLGESAENAFSEEEKQDFLLNSENLKIEDDELDLD